NVANPTGVQEYTALDADADGWAVGFNLGTVFELDKDNRFGLAYHYSPTLEAEGDITGIGVNPATGDVVNATYKNDTLNMPLPSMIEFSGYHMLPDSKFAVHYS
ncbi:outer membrane protein transport protein, partial [Vibrio coralliirubri]|uniref:outer membrane protein transport protein n=2 Tax=Vibrionaceae TaxID=641 RepID=UPI000A5DBEBD